MKPLSGPHQKFAEGIAKGLNATQAYQEAYPKASYDSARTRGADLFANVDIQAEVDRMRKRAETLPGSAVLTLAQKRDFLARLVTASVTTTPADSDLWNSVKTTEFGHEFKLPCKLGAIKLDNDLAGEGSEAGANDMLAGLLGRIRK